MDIWTRLGCYAFFETERMYLRPFTYKDSQDFLRFVAILIIFVLFFQVKLVTMKVII